MIESILWLFQRVIIFKRFFGVGNDWWGKRGNRRGWWGKK